MRYTLIDRAGKISFVGPCLALEALVAACARQPETIGALLDAASAFDDTLPDRVRSGLAVFDEHNTPTSFAHILAALDTCPPASLPLFRVYDERTLQASLTPVGAGVVVFNLPAKRIIQIHNTYAAIQRRGRVRIVHAGRPTNRARPYELPADWSLLP